MGVSIKTIISLGALPTIGFGLIGFGFGGIFPPVPKLLSDFEGWLSRNADYPSLVVAGIVILILWAVYQFLQWQFIRRKREWRRKLNELLKEGVKIRNEGATQIKSKSEAENWIIKAENWAQQTSLKIKKFDNNLGEDFELLDVSPPPRISIKSQIKDHSWHYQHHDYRLVKLRYLIRQTGHGE